MKTISTYYKNQLSKINTKTEYPAQIKVHGVNSDQQTKWIGLNPESAKALVDWLTDNYLKPKKTYFVVENPEKETLTVNGMLAANFLLNGKKLICLYSRSEAIRKARMFNGKAKMFKGTPNEDEHYFKI